MSDIQEGEGARACKNFEELSKYVPGNVYMECLSCHYEWYISREAWNANMPNFCPECGAQAIAHEYAMVGAIKYRWKRENSRSVLRIIPVTDPVQSTMIKRIVRVNAII